MSIGTTGAAIRTRPDAHIVIGWGLCMSIVFCIVASIVITVSNQINYFFPTFADNLIDVKITETKFLLARPTIIKLKIKTFSLEKL